MEYENWEDQGNQADVGDGGANPQEPPSWGYGQGEQSNAQQQMSWGEQGAAAPQYTQGPPQPYGHQPPPYMPQPYMPPAQYGQPYPPGQPWGGDGYRTPDEAFYQDEFLAWGAQAYVAENIEYYWAKWQGRSAAASSPGWNWAAFFLGASWCFYRKLYSLGLIIWLVSCFLPLGGLISSVILGAIGNGQYRDQALTEVRTAMNTCGGDRTAAARILAEKGGTNLGLALGLAFGPMMIYLFLAVIAAAL